MIELYSGTPGSGKSFHVCRRIFYGLRRGQFNVITNFPLTFTEKQEKHIKSKYVCLDNNALTVQTLMDWAACNHIARVESQTLVIIDEAGIKFNSRNWADKSRFQWLDFFSQHRKFGFDFVLVAQADIMLDKQIRQFIEIEHNHRLLRASGIFGKVLSPFYQFLDVYTWYGKNLRLGKQFLRYSKKIASIYDSFGLFNDISKDGK